MNTLLKSLAVAWLAVLIPCAGAHAQIAYESGGIGEEERTAITDREDRYNLKLIFAERGSGAYLAGIRVRIADADGTPLVEATSEGPWFLAHLPPGTYRVDAEYMGSRRNLSVALTPRHPLTQQFYWP